MKIFCFILLVILPLCASQSFLDTIPQKYSISEVDSQEEIFYAIYEGDTSKVITILESGSSTEIRTEFGLKPLDLAHRLHHENIVEILLRFGAKYRGDSKSYLAAEKSSVAKAVDVEEAIRKTLPSEIKEKLHLKPDSTTLFMALKDAIRFRDTASVRYIMSHPLRPVYAYPQVLWLISILQERPLISLKPYLLAAFDERDSIIAHMLIKPPPRVSLKKSLYRHLIPFVGGKKIYVDTLYSEPYPLDSLNGYYDKNIILAKALIPFVEQDSLTAFVKNGYRIDWLFDKDLVPYLNTSGLEGYLACHYRPNQYYPIVPKKGETEQLAVLHYLQDTLGVDFSKVFTREHITLTSGFFRYWYDKKKRQFNPLFWVPSLQNGHGDYVKSVVRYSSYPGEQNWE